MRGVFVILVLVAGVLGSTTGLAQTPLWQIAHPGASRSATIENPGAAYFSSDSVGLRGLLNNAPAESSGDTSSIILLPLPDGSQSRFSIVESPVMSAGLAAKFPEIKTYKVFGIDDPSASGRLDISPAGFRALLNTIDGRVTIDPAGDFYQVRTRGAGASSSTFQCRSTELESNTSTSTSTSSSLPIAGRLDHRQRGQRLGPARQKLGRLPAGASRTLDALHQVGLAAGDLQPRRSASGGVDQVAERLVR